MTDAARTDAAASTPPRLPAPSIWPQGYRNPLLGDVAVMLLEGSLSPGKHGRGMVRELALAYPDCTAVGWRIEAEGGWRRTDRLERSHALSDRHFPESVVPELEAAASGYRVLAPGCPALLRYLHRLHAAAGRRLGFAVGDYDLFLENEGAWPGLRGSLERAIGNSVESGGVTFGCQIASGSLQDAVRTARAYGIGSRQEPA